MGRKRKSLQSWAAEHNDLEVVVKKRKGGEEEETLVCKYCKMEMVTDPAKKPYDRIREHLASARHLKLKEERQHPTMFDVCYRQREREKTAEGAIHACVKAFCESGISLEQAEGSMGDFIRTYCPAAKTMPGVTQLRSKYLTEVFEKHMEDIREDIGDSKVSVIIDESPDVTGVPTVNTLVCFYSPNRKQKQIFLIDVTRVNACNSFTLGRVVTDAVRKVGKTWHDVIAVSSDSAEYVRKMVKDIRASEVVKTVHVRDVPHLLHVTVNHALSSDSVSDVRKVVTKFGAVFKHANKLLSEYYALCVANGVEPADVKRPAAVVPHRWGSFFSCLETTVEFWDCLTEVVEQHAESNNKARDIVDLLNGRKALLYAKAVLLLECLRPIIEIQRNLESGKLLLPEYNYLYSVKLPEVFRSIKETSGSSQTSKTLLVIMPREVSTEAKKACKEFSQKLLEKWGSTTRRNLSEAGPALDQTDIWEKSEVLDPQKKIFCNPDFNTYKDFFSLATDINDELRQQFDMYMQEPPPANSHLQTIQYWDAVQEQYSSLSKAALALLCMPTGSCDVERSFSKLRYLQRPDRSAMGNTLLSMQLILYVNGSYRKPK